MKGFAQSTRFIVRVLYLIEMTCMHDWKECVTVLILINIIGEIEKEESFIKLVTSGIILIIDQLALK